MTTDPNKLRTSADIPLNLITPDEIDTQLGKLTFRDGAPSSDTIQKILDNYDFVRALQVYMDAHQGASVAAFIKGLREIGVEYNDVVIFSELMDSQTLFLTPNADTVYYIAIISLQDGPMVFESPPDALGVIDDTWFGHVIDFGRPGPDRGEGGRFLLLPPDYDGSLPDSGFHVAQARTSRVLVLGRSFLVNNDPKPVVEVIKKHINIYPYTPGGYGTSIKAITSFNSIRNPHRIRAGDYLVIPIAAGGSGELYAGLDDSRVYTVRRGDTVAAIARRFGKRTKDVLRCNGLSWHSKIYPGDALKIPL